MPPAPRDVLQSVFGYPDFRGRQAEIIDHVVAGGDALVLMPTGGGKSLCYQVPALIRPGTAIVVSPLIALMQDQVAALRQLGVRAAALNSALPFAEARGVERDLLAGRLDLLYVAPERLLTDSFLDLLARAEIALFAIDEAHCVSEWGHDFRPEYRQLTLLHERFPQVPRIALTATADAATRRDVAERLQLEDGRRFVASFDRPNIRYRVLVRSEPLRQLRAFLEAEHGGPGGESGIVYCQTRGRVEQVAARLQQHGYTALPYHAGLDKATRAEHQRRFLAEDGVVIVATIAFGMGIDKPDVRFVAHLDLPKSLEAYYQETGRAGRDGLPADAWMVYGMQDAARLYQLVDASEAPEARKQVERRKIGQLLGYCETTRCRRQVLLDYFGERLDAPCGNCGTCLEPVQAFDGTEAAQKVLSCVYRTGQRFGAGHVIDVLLGRDNDKVRRFRHEGLSTFGIGGELTAEGWRSVIRQLVALGLLKVDVDGHGGLSLTPEARPVLRGEQAVELRHDAVRRSPRKAAKPAAAPLAGPADEALFQALRARRAELAKAQGVPPYVIFHDATLVEMARARPADRAQFARLSGVGEAKLRRYADDFLAVIAEADAAA